MRNYHVTNKKGSDEWRVVADNAQRVSATAPTQKKAEQLAKQFTKTAGGGEVRIHKPNGGPIRDSDTVPLAHDPRTSHDSKH